MADARRLSRVTRWVDRAWARRQKAPAATHEFLVERNLPVRTRDGIPLLTDHYLPAGTPGRGTILIRTPYGRGAPINVDARLFAGQGYHVVVQSCRGGFGSGGEFPSMAADGDDGRDTVAWLREQPWFDGRLATYGASAVGWTQWALLADPPPELRTAVVVAGPHDWSRFFHGTGAFRLHDMLTWARSSRHLERFRGLGTLLVFARAARLNAATVRALPLADAADRDLRFRTPWFRRWLTTPDLAVALYRAEPRPPALTAAFDQVKGDDPDLAKWQAAAKDAIPLPSIPEMAAIWDPFGKAEAAVVGGADPAKTIEAAGKTISASITK